MKVIVLESWRYADPALVLEQCQDQALAREAAMYARIRADEEARAVRADVCASLSPITKRLVRRLQVERALRDELKRLGAAAAVDLTMQRLRSIRRDATWK